MAKVRRGGLKTGRKKRFNIEELNAYATAYGKAVGRKDYLMYVLMPGLVAAFFTTILYYNVVVSLVGLCVGMFYGLNSILPKTVKRKYMLAALNERGRFITLMTQIASNEDKSMLRVTYEATERLNKSGELYNDMIMMVSNIGTDITRKNVQAQFRGLRVKYNVDPTFTQFLEQVETGIINGDNNVGTLQEIAMYHSQMRKNMANFIKIKDAHMLDYRMITGLVIVLTLIASYSIGIGDFIKGFSHTWVGLAFGGVFLGLNVFFYLQITKMYFDDEITSIGG